MCIFCEKAQAQLAEGGFEFGLTPAQKREAESCDRLREKRVRATILTGFLGAGKTTFLNFVLTSKSHGKRVAVVQNEFGSVSIDDQLMPVERSDTEIVTMPNGCICCRVRGDLVDALRRLAARSADGGSESLPIDTLLIECSGLSEVLPVAQTFFADPYVQASYALDGVVCVCDAGNFEALEGRGDASAPGDEESASVANLLREQLALSDVCLLNKCDLVDATTRDRIGRRVREVSPSIKVVPCRHGKVNLQQVLQIGSFSLDTALSVDVHFLDGQGAPVSSDGHGGGHGDGHGHGHEEEGAEHGGRSGHAHELFGSLGLEVQGPVDIEAVKAWLRDVVEKHGERLVRLKGILHTVGGGSGRRTIVQGVGGHIDVGEEQDAPPGGGGGASSRLVLIGRIKDFKLQAELRAGFMATAAARM